MTTEERLQHIVSGAKTLDKQEIMNNVCAALGVDPADVRITPGDVDCLREQLIEEAR